MVDIIFSLGSNMGDREGTIERALTLLEKRIGPLKKRSSFYYSPSWGYDSPNEFCNICALFETDLNPYEVLEQAEEIERELGRNKDRALKTQAPIGLSRTYADRTIDIDIIKMGDIQMTSPTLTIPHPLYKQREFVTIPLAELE